MVHGPAQQQVTAYTYTAIDIDSKLLPYSWYLNHVIVGAKEVGVPEEYLNGLNKVAAIKEPDNKRDALNRVLYD